MKTMFNPSKPITEFTDQEVADYISSTPDFKLSDGIYDAELVRRLCKAYQIIGYEQGFKEHKFCCNCDKQI